MNIVFFGTPDFAVGTLRALVENGYRPLAIVTRPDKPKGRSGKPSPSPVKKFAETYLPNVPIFQPEKASSPEFTTELASLHADLFVVVAYGEILSQQVLDLPKMACINVHASLLPELRGAAPIHRAIIEGKRESGVTIMHMVKKMDAGDMIRQAKIPIHENMTTGELHDALMEVGSLEIVNAVQDFERGKVSQTPQDESKVTFAKKIELEDCEINWSQPAQNIHNLIRGSSPYPGAWCWIDVKGERKRLKILESRIIREKNGVPGTIITFGKSGITVATGEGSILLVRLKLEGKKEMNSPDFCCGYNESEIVLK